MDNKKKLWQFLKVRNLMSVATLANKELCVCTVYYCLDKDFNLYFISEPESEHLQNLVKNKTVAVSIADSTQKVTAKKIGAQIKGQAVRITGLKTLKILALWNSANPGFAKIINFKNIKNKVIASQVWQIKPKTIKWFNEVLYGEEGFEIFKF